MPDANAATGLLLVQKRLYQQRGGEDLVARAVEQVGARHVRSADRLALATAQTVLDGIGDVSDVRLLHDQRLVPQQVEARCIGIGQVASGHQLTAIETTLRVDALLVYLESAYLRVVQKLKLRDADTVFA